MAVRVTATEVKAIMDNCTKDDTVIDVFINSANLALDEAFSGVPINSSLLKELERWLSAHLVASTIDRIAAEEEVGDTRIKYTGKWYENLGGTPYGQNLMVLDTTGTISKLAKQKIRLIAITQPTY